MRFCVIVLLLLTVAAVFIRPAWAEELVEAKGCVACHGVDGVATAPIYPNLRGQWARYLQLQLRAYRSGVRQNTIMQGFAAGLTNEEIRALAGHYGER